MAVWARKDLLIEVAVLAAIEDDEIQAILERLQGGGDRGALVNRLVELTPTRVDLATRRTLVDLLGGQDAHEVPLVRAFAEGRDLGRDDAADQRTERERLGPACGARRERDLPLGDERPSASGRSCIDLEQDPSPCAGACDPRRG